MLFLASIWVEKQCHDMERMWRPLNRISIAFRRHKNKVLTAILVIHLVGGVVAAQYDYRYTFSQAKATAKFIKKGKLNDLIIAGDRYTEVAPIGGYLGKKLYYPRIRGFGSFWFLKKGWWPDVTVDNLLKEVRRLGGERAGCANHPELSAGRPTSCKVFAQQGYRICRGYRWS